MVCYLQVVTLCVDVRHASLCHDADSVSCRLLAVCALCSIRRARARCARDFRHQTSVNDTVMTIPISQYSRQCCMPETLVSIAAPKWSASRTCNKLCREGVKVQPSNRPKLQACTLNLVAANPALR